MKRSPKQKVNAALNLFHKGFVLTCVGVTVVGTVILGYQGYKYVTVMRPQLAEKRRLAENELLAEGSSDTLKDPALNIA